MAKSKKNLIQELKGLKKEDVEKKLKELREEERQIHFKSEGARSKNVKELSNLRKQIARVLTFLNK